MAQETQQKTFNFVKNSKGEITFKALPPLPVSFRHLMRAIRTLFMLNMVAIPTSHIIRLYGSSHIIKPLLRAVLLLRFELLLICNILLIV